jgi:hypothetical protein
MPFPFRAVAAVALVVAACRAPVPDTGVREACVVPRLAGQWRNTPSSARPADPVPRPSVLPIPPLTDAEAAAAGDCIRPALAAIAAKSDNAVLRESTAWPRFSRQFYASEHGRFIEVSGNAPASGYGRWEDGPRLPIGAVVKKQSFHVLHSGEVRPDNQFLIERMPAGYDERVGDWKYSAVGPDGVTIGESRGRNGDRVEFCVECHKSARRQDFLFFIPPDYRARS